MTDEDIERAKALILDSKLVSVDYHELSAKRLVPESVQEGDEGSLSVEVQLRSDDTSFGVRLMGEATFPAGSAVASVAGEYELLNDAHPSQRTLRVFANEVAIMTVFPYLREAISSVTARVFQEPLLLPIVNRGEISVDLEGDNA